PSRPAFEHNALDLEPVRSGCRRGRVETAPDPNLHAIHATEIERAIWRRSRPLVGQELRIRTWQQSKRYGTQLRNLHLDVPPVGSQRNDGSPGHAIHIDQSNLQALRLGTGGPGPDLQYPVSLRGI